MSCIWANLCMLLGKLAPHAARKLDCVRESYFPAEESHSHIDLFSEAEREILVGVFLVRGENFNFEN